MNDFGVGGAADAGYWHEPGADVLADRERVLPVSASLDPGWDPYNAGEIPVSGIPAAAGRDRGDAWSA